MAVVDTGWPSRMPPNMDWFRAGADHEAAPGEVDESGHPLRHIDHLDDDRDGYLDVEAGHGLFVAGLVRRMAPQAKLVFLKALNSDGVGTELGVARAIRAATARKVDVINLSLGFYTVLDAHAVGRRGRGGRRRRRRHRPSSPRPATTPSPPRPIPRSSRG